jgi:hypothetical protein
VIHASRSRYSPGRRGLALWLIMAQLMLFTAAGLVHMHAASVGGSPFACTPGDGLTAADRVHLTAPGASRHGVPSACIICQVTSTTVASLAAAPHILLVGTLCGHVLVPPRARSRVLSLGLPSSRAPPIA